ncbi:GNAT family N-acetyltransferase [Noviherbaspirillum sp.]|uniref:GNAT family N-acetyltransferase n=1 Tax=Noviherbaspirillum sp. TaxID=1926288 RepID=UPI002B4A3F79|nr:GNAT family N-acetyltransferase [Noviherbaspirillum sp.]
MEHQGITISCYDDEVPPFVEAEIERLYGNIFSSLLEFRIYGWSGADTGTYVERTNGKITTLIVFERRRGRVRVLNQGIRIGADELNRFAQCLFSQDRSIQVISLKAIETDIEHSAFPMQRFNHLEDLALALPTTTQEYLASLGKNTRRNIKRYMDRLMRRFPSFSFEVHECGEVDEKEIRALIAFNRMRMAEKNVVANIDEEETRHIISLAQACGLVGIARIDGRICAGAVSYRAGNNYFLNLLSHDPAYDDYWVGFLCCYLTMCACIARGAHEFHFLWGRYEYKYALGAVQRDLDNVHVYRSWLHFALNANMAWEAAREGYLRRAKLWLKYGDRPLSKRIRKLVEAATGLRHSLSAMAGLRRRCLLQSNPEN